MKQVLIDKNIEYLQRKGVQISNNIIESVKDKHLPELDELICFSNNSGISINDFLFVDIEQRETLS